MRKLMKRGSSRGPMAWILPGLAMATALSLAAGCSASSGDDTNDSPTPFPGDLDRDGYNPISGDCDETSTSIHPGASEVCNGLDDDCDGTVDPDCDADQDGYLSLELGGDDCDDTRSAVHPGAVEVCDTLDNNCDGVIDNAQDTDGDGFGPCATTSGPADCDDGDLSVYPGALEVFDGKLDDCSSLAGVDAVAPAGAALTLEGEFSGDLAGTVVARAGDLNGDSYPDLVATAPSANGGAIDAGKVYLFFGGPDYTLHGLSASIPTAINFRFPDVAFVGATAGDLAGSYASGVGDVDGDGIDDLWIGAPGANQGAGSGYLIRGRSDWSIQYRSLADADVIFPGSAPAGGLGPASGGDVDGDGTNDLLIGAPGETSGAGAAYLLYGGPALLTGGSSWISGAVRIPAVDTGSQTGWAVSLEGDLQGDGLHDLVVAAPGAGKVYVIFAQEGSWTPALDKAEISLIGDATARAGSAISFRGDLNRDGYSDLAIGAPGPLGGDGALYVLLGARSGLAVQIPMEDAEVVLTGETGAQLGASLSTGGDLNGDEIDDLVVGAPGTALAYFIPGWTEDSRPTSGVITDADRGTFNGPSGSRSGHSQSITGDLNGDGLDEWASGAPSDGAGGDQSGSAFLLLGYRR